jgi:hypothetical protein|tara:strand:+ start:1572 stop:1916 length:345 start_codon:yes stop_codon:yes gene_type:complete
MRTLLYILTVMAVIALAFWSYQENYETRKALNGVDESRSDIREAHARLGVLRAEWAYLNRPSRLLDLAEFNYDRLGLLPIAPEQFGMIDQIAYPTAPLLPILNPVDVSNTGGQP